MTLKTYQKKRKFNQTPEPRGKIAKPKATPLFVVQKHQARQLHYDFRLEAEGVLKSWAVPKGPSMNPAYKRLAMMVEDHPYDYKDFEGVIPSGNYGAGTVIVWDRGNYAPLNAKSIIAGLKKGEVKFALNGKKLKGGFVLIKMKRRGENAWLLIKEKDEHAKKIDIIKQDKSVKSGKTLEQVAKSSEEN